MSTATAVSHLGIASRRLSQAERPGRHPTYEDARKQRLADSIGEDADTMSRSVFELEFAESKVKP